jgi:predicted GNAT superfamily acetyltransferase
MKDLEKVITLKGKRFLLQVEASSDARDYEKFETLRNEIWGFPEDSLPGSRNLMCENFLHDGGALFIGVYAEAPGGTLSADAPHCVGFSYGFVGVKDKEMAFRRPDNLRFYSQYTGLKEDFRHTGLGVAVKEFQREKVLGLFGIASITCTYDPLTGVNARRNIHHFGMEVAEYRVSTYGEYGGLLNRLDVPSDRFFMTWDLRRRVGRKAMSWAPYCSAEHLVLHVEERELNCLTRPLRLEVVGASEFDRGAEIMLVRIPCDFYLMLRETDVVAPAIRQIPIDWRRETRRAFQALFQKGYRVIDFFQAREEPPKNFYVLRKSQNTEKKGDRHEKDQ